MINEELAPVSRRRRAFLGLLLTGFLVVVVSLAGLAATGTLSHHATTNAAAGVRVKNNLIQVIHRSPAVWKRTKDVPVLVYHEMNNGCKPTAARCVSHDPETVSTNQFRREMNYLVVKGYHTITLTQYEHWLANPSSNLPAKPILLTADNGIGNFLEGAQPILAHDGMTATAFLVTGFADGAAGHCEPPRRLGGHAFNVQPGCGSENKGWDLTWPELRALSPRVWSFALEAGQSGHFVQDYAPHCQMFDTCLLPGETIPQYHKRVTSEINGGITEAKKELGSRFNQNAWVVPYSDLGYPQCSQADCTPQETTSPRGWLPSWGAHKFQALFIEDGFRNGVHNERFRMDVNGDYGLRRFKSLLTGFIAAGAFNRHHA